MSPLADVVKVEQGGSLTKLGSLSESKPGTQLFPPASQALERFGTMGLQLLAHSTACTSLHPAAERDWCVPSTVPCSPAQCCALYPAQAADPSQGLSHILEQSLGAASGYAPCPTNSQPLLIISSNCFCGTLVGFLWSTEAWGPRGAVHHVVMAQSCCVHSICS